MKNIRLLVLGLIFLITPSVAGTVYFNLIHPELPFRLK